MKMKSLISVVFVCALFANFYAQQTDTARRGCVTEEGKQLNFLVGEWKVASKARVAGGENKWEEVNGSSKIKFLFDQCLLVEKLSIKREGRPLDIFAIYSYNNISKNYQWSYAHSEHGMLSLYEGPLENDKFTFRYEFEINGGTIMFKRELTRLSDGFKMVASRSNNNGKSWRRDSVLIYSR